MVKNIATLILLLGVSLVIAQPMNNQPCNPVGPDPSSDQSNIAPGGPNPDQMYDDMLCQMPMGNPKTMMHDMKNPKEMVETIRIWKLTQLLNLSEDQSTKFFPKLNTMRQLRDDYENNRMKAITELDDMLKAEKKDDKAIADKLAEIDQYDAKFQANEAKMKKDVASVLTTEQQAKFMMFQMRFEEDLRMAIHKAQGMKEDAIKKWQENKPDHNRPWRFW